MRFNTILLTVFSLFFSIVLLDNAKAQKYGISTGNYLGVVGGITYSSFKFNSTDKSNQADLGFKSGFNFGLSYIKWISESQNLGAEVSYMKSGATGSTGNTSIIWNLDLAGAAVYYGYKIINSNKYVLEPGIIAGADFIVDANQIIDDRRFSLQGKSIFNPLIIKGGLSVKNYMYFQDYADLLLEYRYCRGISNIEEKDLSFGQSTYLYYHILNFGIRIHI